MSDGTHSTDWAIGRLEQALRNLDRVATNRDEIQSQLDDGEYARAGGMAVEALKEDRRNADHVEGAIEDVLEVLEAAEVDDDE